MGLWGLFTAMVGIGTVTKDSLLESIENDERYDKANNSGNPTYYVYGKLYSTKTRRPATIRYENGWTILRDLKTGAYIDNISEYKNKRKTEDSKREADEAGEVFYRTYKYNSRSSKPVYVSDSIPGFFYRQYDNRIGEYVYEKGELVKEKEGGDDVYRVETAWINGEFILHPESYFSDGVLKTNEEYDRRLFDYAMARTIKFKKKFCTIPEEVLFYVKVETGEIYRYVKSDGSYWTLININNGEVEKVHWSDIYRHSNVIAY